MQDDKWQNGQNKDGFNTRADERTKPRKAPSPKDLDKAGIKSEAVFDRMAAQQPEPPKLDLTPDNDQAVKHTEREQKQRQIAKQREDFRRQFKKSREHFNDIARKKPDRDVGGR